MELIENQKGIDFQFLKHPILQSDSTLPESAD